MLTEEKNLFSIYADDGLDGTDGEMEDDDEETDEEEDDDNAEEEDYDETSES